MDNDYGSDIRALLEDSKNHLWVVSDVSLEQVDLNGSPDLKVKSGAVLIPPYFYANYLVELDSDRLLMEGLLYDTVSRKSNLASLIYNHEKDSTSLSKGGFLSISYNGPKGLLRDVNGTLWMAHYGDNENESGLYISDNGSEIPEFRRLDINPPASYGQRKSGGDPTWSLYEDRAGYIWVASLGNGLYKIDPKKVPVDYINIGILGDESKPSFNEIGEDAAGNIWLNSEQKGLFKYDIKVKEIAHITKNRKKMNTIFFKGKDGALILSDLNQARQYHPSNVGIRSLPLQIKDSLTLIGYDSYGNYWGVLRPDPNASYFYVFNGDKFQQVNFDSTKLITWTVADHKLFLGKNGNIWIMPDFGGVHQYKIDDRTKKVRFQKKYLSEGIFCRDMFESDAGITWIATLYDGLIRLDGEKNTTKAFNKSNGLPSNAILKLIPFKDKIWVITDLGSAFIDLKDGTITSSKQLDQYIRQNVEGFFQWHEPYRDLAISLKSGNLAVIAKNGFFVFNPADFSKDTSKPILLIDKLIVNKQLIEFEKTGKDSQLKFDHDENDFEIAYVGLHYNKPKENQYSYFLSGANKEWITAGTQRLVRFSNLAPGHYEFFLKASNADGEWSKPQMMVAFTVLSPWWETGWAYASYAALAVLAIWSFIAYRSRQLVNENVLLEAKVEQRTTELNHSLESLKSTQRQLIQSEKMASLGELTAGIAHEIQNPLNFVNNFSELNKELIDEMQHEMKSGNSDEAFAISSSIRDNEEKINHHGKRAGGILKSMLHHGSPSTGVMEETNLNSLVDEYLNLVYHGLQAKDKSFRPKMKTDYDETVGNVIVVPQDLGRVIVNVLNNAFQAMAEKWHRSPEHFEPAISVSTNKFNNTIKIHVKDNGDGIPIKVIDKIFQPFFTTKPTGQGTGLGLSLSYDIMKAMGGDIKVISKEDEGAEFIIDVPV